MQLRGSAALVAIGGLLAIAVPAHAIDLTVGLGAAFAPDYEGSDDYELGPTWFLRASPLLGSETFVEIRGTRLSSNLIASPHWRAGLAGNYRFDYDDVDERDVRRLRNPESALLLGPTLGYDFDARAAHELVLEVDALYDVANGNGGTITPRLRGRMPLAPSLIGDLRLSTTWGSNDFMENWFDVTNNDANRTGLNQFNADEGFKDVTVAGSIVYQFTANWSVTGTASYSLLVGDAADSPIVDDRGDENQFLVGALVNYTF
jgi:outer membrane protein